VKRKPKPPKVECEYLRKLCKTGCDNYVCRAFFPERQPNIVQDRIEEICKQPDHRELCERWVEGRLWHIKRRERGVGDPCKYASNTVCGKPDEWWCKGHVPPFRINNDELSPCISGDMEIYVSCPHYKMGEAFREEWRRVKGVENK